MAEKINDVEYSWLLARVMLNTVPVEFRKSAITPMGAIQNYIAALEFALEKMGVDPAVAVDVWRKSLIATEEDTTQ